MGVFYNPIVPGAIPATGAAVWAGRSQITSPFDGALTLYNNAKTGFTYLQFGGGTGSFPMLKASGITIQCRLADDSGFGVIQGLISTSTSYVAGTVTPTGTLTLYDNTGTAYRVPCLV